MKNNEIILGSGSKGRQIVLSSLGYEFDVVTADIDEKAIRHDDPRELTLKLGHAKADAILPRISKRALLITGDQVVACNNKILEKPENEIEVREFLNGYASCPPETVSSIVVTNTETGKRVDGVDRVKITFSKIPDNVIDKIVEKGDVFSCAGGFSVKDPLLKDYILKVDGEIESVIGLPKTLLAELINKIVAEG